MKRNIILVCGFVAMWGLQTMEAVAVRLLTNPATSNGDPQIGFNSFAVHPNGTTIIANGAFNNSLVDNVDRLYSFDIPSDPTVDIVSPTQISTQSFGFLYDIERPPVVSPDGLTALVTHSNVPGTGEGVDTIAKIPVAGEGFNLPTGVFGTPDNLVAPGLENRRPVFSPDGSTLLFENINAGVGGGTDVLYSVPFSSGSIVGTPVPIMPANEGIGNYAFTQDSSTVVYTRGGSNNAIYTVPVGGGTRSEIAVTPSSNPAFDIAFVDLAVTATDVFFVGDYETAGQNELFSVPLTGGTPTKINDTLPPASSVERFQVAPNGNSVAYIAGQNDAGTLEVFLTPSTGGTGNSFRVSDAPVSGAGDNGIRDAFGTLGWSPDSQWIYYVGAMTTPGVNDFYIVDTTEKLGLIPDSASRILTYVGADGGSLQDPTNWLDGNGNNPPATLLQNDIPADLTVDGNQIVASDVDFGDGGVGSLTLINGASLTVNAGQDIDMDEDSALTMTGGSFIVTGDDAFLEGNLQLNGGSITAGGDDIIFRPASIGTIDGTVFTAEDNIRFEDGAVDQLTIVNATFNVGTSRADPAGSNDHDFNIDDQNFNLTVTDTTINIIDDILDNDTASAGTLTLLGASSLSVDDLLEGADVVLGGTSTATIGIFSDDNDADVVLEEFAYLGFEGDNDNLGSTVSLISTDASLTVPALTITGIDPRDFIINGLTGLTYNQDPSAWNITNWDGQTAETLSINGLSGDFDGDGDVDGTDFLYWQRNDGSSAGLAAWQSNYGSGGAPVSSATAVPEPTSAILALLASASLLLKEQRKRGV